MKINRYCANGKCDNEPHQELVGGVANWYCCKKGFFIALDEFSKHVASLYKCNVCKDEHFVEHRGKSIPCPTGCYLTPVSVR